MKTQLSHPVFGTITVTSTFAMRRVSVAVFQTGVRLRVPFGVSVADGISFMEKNRDFILQSIARVKKRSIENRQYSADEKKEIIRRASCELPPLFEELSRNYFLPVKSFSLTLAHSFWGICTSDNRIRLSVSVVILPEELRRYIILHELVHTLHHNHSKKFHKKLDELLGGREKQYIALMKKYKTVNFSSRAI